MKKLLNFRLTLFIALSCVAGIVLSYCLLINFIALAVLVGAIFFSCNLFYLFIYSTKETRRKRLIFSIIFLLIFIISITSFFITVKNYENADLDNHYYFVEGRICQSFDTSYGKKYLLTDVSIKGNVKTNLKFKIELFVNQKSDYKIGDIISFSSYLEDKPLFYEGRFSSYSIEKGVKYSANVSADNINYLSSNPTIFEKVNLFIKNGLKEGLDAKQFAVAYALLTGNSDYIDIDTLTSYRQAGVAHIFAVSGLHIGFLAMAIGFVLDKLKSSRLLKTLTISTLLFFYAGVCGFSASSIRAAIMTSVMLLGSISGEKYDGISSISVACTLILLFMPVELFCVGFQLSFVVVLGILLLSPLFNRFFKFLPKKFANSLSTVLSAQIFGFPILLMAFGEASLISIIANLIFIPVVCVIFIATLLLLFIGAIFNIYSLALFIPNLALKLINILITAFDYDIFMFGGILLGISTIFYYLSFITASGFFNLKVKTKRIVSLIFAGLFIVGTFGYNLYVKEETSLIVSGSDDICATIISSSNYNVMVISDANKNYSTYKLGRIVKNNNIKHIDELIITDGFEVDIPAFIVALRSTFTLEHICYFGERDEMMENIIYKIFPLYTVNNYVEGKSILAENDTNISFGREGKSVEARIKDKKILIFSTLKRGNVNYLDYSEKYDYCVFLDQVNMAVKNIEAKTKISYLKNLNIQDTQTLGNLTFFIR